MISATISRRGSITITKGTDTERLDGKSLEHARTLLVEHLRPEITELTVHVEDPVLGQSFITIAPTGTVTVMGDPPATDEQADTNDAVDELKQDPAYAAPTEAETALIRRRDLRGRAAESFSQTRRAKPTGPAELGWRGWLNRFSGGSLTLAPDAHEERIRCSRRSVQRGLNSHKTIAFVNIKGGVGKSTNCYLTGAIYGRERGGSVLAWDSNPDKGTLGERAMHANHDHTAIDLLEQADFFADHTRNEEDLVNFVRSQGENRFDVLASQNTSSTAVSIDGEGFTTLHKVLKRFYRLILVDTGNASNTDTWQAAVSAADVLVICTLNKEDAAKTAAATLDTLEAQGHGDKVANAVVVISQTQTPSAQRMGRITGLFGDLVRAVIEVPFDKHLDEGEEIEWNNLSSATQEAFLHVAAAITNGLQHERNTS